MALRIGGEAQCLLSESWNNIVYEFHVSVGATDCNVYEARCVTPGQAVIGRAVRRDPCP